MVNQSKEISIGFPANKYFHSNFKEAKQVGNIPKVPTCSNLQEYCYCWVRKTQKVQCLLETIIFITICLRLLRKA